MEQIIDIIVNKFVRERRISWMGMVATYVMNLTDKCGLISVDRTRSQPLEVAHKYLVCFLCKKKNIMYYI